MAAMTTDPGSRPTTTSHGAGPLTTVFSTPEFCEPHRWTDIATPPLSSSICMPPNFMEYYGNKAGMYSPGICPMGYTEGCALPPALATMENGTPLYGGPLLAGETARLCCPTGYTCFTGPGTVPDIPYSKCISAAQSSRTYVEYDSGLNQRLTRTARNVVYAIQVRWQSSDLSLLETDPTVPGSTYTGPRGTTTATATAKPGDNGGPGPGLPTNVIIALVIAMLLFSILLGIAGYLFWRRHYWKHQVLHRELASTPDLGLYDETHYRGASAVPTPLTPAASEMGDNTFPRVHEADAGTRPWMELEAREEAQELPPTSFAPVELEGSTPAHFTQPQQQQQQEEEEDTTSKGGDSAAGGEKSEGVMRRRTSLGVNRLSHPNPPPPYSSSTEK